MTGAANLYTYYGYVHNGHRIPTQSAIAAFLMKQGLVFLAVVCALLATSVIAGASPLNLDPTAGSYPLTQCFDVAEDVHKAYRIDDLQTPAVAAQFHPITATGEINFGYSESAYWLRCNLSAPTASSWFLEIAYPSLDSVQVFTPDRHGNYRMQEASDHLPFSARPYPHRNYVFPLELNPGQTTLYLRVRSDGTLTIPATLWVPEAFHKQDTGIYTVLAIYYGMFIALGLYNLLLFFSLRDHVYLEYVLFITSIAIGQASLNGLGNQFLWPDWPVWGNVALPVGFALSGLFGALFTRSFLVTPANVPRLNLLNWLFIGWFTVAILAHLYSYRLASEMTSLGGVGYSLFAWWVGLYCLIRHKQISARYFLLAWTLLIIGVCAMGARNFGWVPTSFFTTYAIQIGSSLEMLLLSFALAQRIHTVRKEKHLAQAETLATKQQMEEVLQGNEQKLEARVKVRTNELEVVNDRLRDSEQALAKVARQDPLTGLGNRIALHDELNAALERARRAQTGVAVLLIDLDNFKPINDTYGHAVGDNVLVGVAQRLKISVRKSDSVIRIGGDEFVVIMEGLQVIDHAKALIAKLLQLLAEPLNASGILVHVGASIGMSRFPEDGATIQDLMDKADTFMYAAKAAGGKSYRYSG